MLHFSHFSKPLVLRMFSCFKLLVGFTFCTFPSFPAFDASLLGIVNELFWIGVQVRNVVNSDNFQPTNNFGTSVLLGLSLGERFSVGYSYGVPSSMTNKGFNTSTHELMLRYDLIARVKGYLRSPRFF